MNGISPGKTVSALRSVASAGDTNRRSGQTATTRSRPGTPQTRGCADDLPGRTKSVSDRLSDAVHCASLGQPSVFKNRCGKA